VSRATELAPYDEAYDERGRPRAHYAELLGAIGDPDALRDEAMRRLGARGVTFGGGETARFDPVPRILTEPEWSELQGGIVQRLRAPGVRRRRTAGPRVDAACSRAKRRRRRRAEPVTRRGAATVGRARRLDVIRCEDGRFRVIEISCGCRGHAYAVAWRETLRDRSPWSRRSVTCRALSARSRFARRGAGRRRRAEHGDPSRGPARRFWEHEQPRAGCVRRS
jgi:hypothetical protein